MKSFHITSAQPLRSLTGVSLEVAACIGSTVFDLGSVGGNFQNLEGLNPDVSSVFEWDAFI